MGICVVITSLDSVTPSEVLRIDLRAQHIYRGLPPLLPWGDAGEATRNEFRRRAMSLMLFDGSLLYGTLPGGEDYGYAELQVLEAEASAVICGELKAGEMRKPAAGDSGPTTDDSRDGVIDDVN
jgi:hypothetical protein